MRAAVITTFANQHWQPYAKEMVRSFVQYWPQEIPLLIALDDDLLYEEVNKMLRPQDAIAVGWEADHKNFVERNKDKDDPTNYRKQAVRFCHKVFAIDRAHKAIKKAKADGIQDTARYLIWLDADVHTTAPVTLGMIQECLPKEGDAVSYLGRKDWPHSECGWLAFDLESGADLLDDTVQHYVSDSVFGETEWHDSWIWDLFIKDHKATNLTKDKPGMDIWPHSPMGKWSTHYKGPNAKAQLQGKPMQNSNVMIQTMNSIPHEEIRAHIEENQSLIKNWIQECTPNNEEVVVVSAGPQLVAEDVLEDYRAGKKIVAVKHALERLKAAGIKPWACILLDPRPHVYDFVKDPDKDVIWFVASQVDPKVTMKLLACGCEVWGYHAAVGADEGPLTSKQMHAVIAGGSATATRGLYVLKHLGFHKIKLFGYDLCYPDKPDLNARDSKGQPKHLEISVASFNMKKCFWSEPQLIAQFEEMNQIIQNNVFELDAVGEGIIPFILKSKKIAELRQPQMGAKIPQKTTYRELLCKKPSFWKRLLKN